MSATGSCKLCQSPLAPAVNRLIEDEKNAAEAQRIMEQFGLTFNRRTYYNHKDHVTHPLVTAVEKSQQNPVIVPKSNREGLESIRDLGLKRAMENPDEVTVDHAIKAMDLLHKQDAKGENVRVILAKVLMGAPPQSGPILEGEYLELEGGNDDEPSGSAD